MVVQKQHQGNVFLRMVAKDEKATPAQGKVVRIVKQDETGGKIMGNDMIRVMKSIQSIASMINDAIELETKKGVVKKADQEWEFSGLCDL